MRRFFNMNMEVRDLDFEQLKEKAHDLPRQPGVYIMKDKDGTIIYVGKAKALKNRVSSYFANLASHTAKTRQMVSKIDSFDTIYAGSEFEALLLENTLIKKHKPKYNILLKDAIAEVNQKLPSYKRVHNLTIRETEFVKTTTKKIRRQDNIPQ